MRNGKPVNIVQCSNNPKMVLRNLSWPSSLQKEKRRELRQTLHNANSSTKLLPEISLHCRFSNQLCCMQNYGAFMVVYNFHKLRLFCHTSSDKAINYLMDQNEAFDILDMTITIFQSLCVFFKIGKNTNFLKAHMFRTKCR